ncbi:MAG: family 20 glycosylhydrolase, partial [Calditrichia bacterium]|nr:family 20 glycosylhydrolase [Calditrichia bacterium]
MKKNKIKLIKNKYTLFICFLLMIVSVQTFAKNIDLNLMPIPAKISKTSQKYRLDDSFKMTVTGKGHPRIFSASTRMLRRLGNRTGLFFGQDFLTADEKVTGPDFTVECVRPGEVKLGENESYVLTVSAKKITLRAENDLGAMHGLETLLQLLSVDEKGYYFPGVTIEDQPRFKWRGLLIDVGRHFMPVDVIKRNLDGMASVKMNVLHWHLTEDQGFRVESKIYPRLHKLGSDGFFYTQEQIKDIL